MKHLHAPQQFATFTPTSRLRALPLSRLRAVLFTHFPEENRETAFGYPTPPRTILSACALATLLAAPAAWANFGGQTFNQGGFTNYGGFGSGNTVIFDENNTVERAVGGLSDKDSTSPKILDKTGKANRNTLTVTGTVDYASGGAADDTAGNAEATGNHLYVKGTVNYNAYGGYSDEGSATGNFVFIDGGTVDRALGGFAWRGDATGNTVTLISGKVTSAVLGGSCSPTPCNDVSNILAVQGKDFPVDGDVTNFDTLNFTLPADIKHNETMLSVGTDATFGKWPSYDATVKIAMADGATLNKGDTITLISASRLNITLASTTVTTADDYEFALSVDTFDNKLVATVTKLPPTYAVKGTANPTEGGSVDCGVTQVVQGGSITCTAAANAGYTYDDDSIRLASGSASVACSVDTCTLTNVTSNVEVSATFTKDPASTPGGGGGAGGGTGGGGAGGGTGDNPPQPYEDSSSPTMGELGLLLSGLALAGAAAPALRRREKQGKKTDTRQ